jgi:hypothetical protein
MSSSDTNGSLEDSVISEALQQLTPEQRKQIDDLYSLCAEQDPDAVACSNPTRTSTFISLVGLRRVAGNLSDKELIQLFERLDQDNDGRIQYREWVIGCARWLLNIQISMPDASSSTSTTTPPASSLSSSSTHRSNNYSAIEPPNSSQAIVCCCTTSILHALFL